MTSQLSLFDGGLENESGEVENDDYATSQLITYIGNKRGLAGPIEQAE